MSCCSFVELFFESRPLFFRRASFEPDQVAQSSAVNYLERTRSRSRRDALHGDKIAFFAEPAFRYVAAGHLHHDFPDGFGFSKCRRFGEAEAFPAFPFAAVCEKAIKADAHQGFRKRVHKRSSDEFYRVDHHGLDGSLFAFFVGEGHLSVGKIENSTIGDRDPVRVAAEIVDDAVEIVERGFHVDDHVFDHRAFSSSRRLRTALRPAHFAVVSPLRQGAF